MINEKNPNRILRELAQPFSMKDLEWRVQQAGVANGRPWARIIAYVTNRALQARLDSVVGCFNWKNEYKELPMEAYDKKSGVKINGCLSGISIRFGSEWITKWDGADNTDIEPIKGALSGAMKRAGVQWGIGRYLYDVEAMYAISIGEEAYKSLKKHEKEEYTRAKAKEKIFDKATRKTTYKDVYFYWKPSELSSRFLPKKYILPNVVNSIKELCSETDTKVEDILFAYGVEDIRDLYGDEAGIIINQLIVKKNRQKEK